MYVCICNAISEKLIKRFLSSQKGCKTSVSATYKACSGGESPNCCKCIKDIRNMVGEHNHEITVKALEGDMSKPSETIPSSPALCKSEKASENA